MTGAATDDVVIELISYGEERSRRDAEHGVIYDPPFGRVTGLHWKGAALKWNGISRMSLGVVHVHVQALSSSVDLVIKLVRPGSDDLLEIVVAELAVVKRVIARVDGISLIRRGPLD